MDDDSSGQAADRMADLGCVVDAHLGAEFVDHDLEATMRTMTAEPYLDHVPVMTGGVGATEVRAFYRDHFIGHWPADTKVERLSRTEGSGRVVDELMVSFTHTCKMPAILPGVAPTGRLVELPFVVVMGFDGGKIAYEHIYWDQASMLVQVGLVDARLLPATGVEQARKLLDKRLPSNELMAHRAIAAAAL